MNKEKSNTDWSVKLLENGGKLVGSSNYHFELLQVGNVYEKIKKEFYLVHNIYSLMKKIN